LGCDGIFEKIGNEETLKSVIQKANVPGESNVHERCNAAVDKVLVTCVKKKTLDNITAVFISFNGFECMTSNKL